MDKIKLGFAPTRRSIFSAPDAIKYRGLTADRLTELGIDYVDITDINEEGLLYNDEDSSNRRKSTGCSCPTATSARSMNVQGLPRNWVSRCFYGGLWMKDRTKTGSV